jgi:hypothetical protein
MAFGLDQFELAACLLGRAAARLAKDDAMRRSRCSAMIRASDTELPEIIWWREAVGRACPKS